MSPQVISLGYKENVTVAQIKQNTEMESHEEKVHKMIIQSKINDTKDVMKRKAVEIDKGKLDRAREAKSPMAGYAPTSMGSAAGRGSDLDSSTPTYSRPEPSFAAFKPTEKGPPRGMQLGKVG